MPFNVFHTQVVISGICSGVNTVTTLRFTPLATTLAEKQALAIAVRDRWLPEFKTGCAAAMNFTNIAVRVIGVQDDVPYSLTINVVGGGASLAPQQIAICWNLFSGFALRRGRGRLFVPGIHKDALAGGVLASTTKVSLDAAINTIIGRWCTNGTETYKLMVGSRLNNAVYNVSSITANSILSTLRTRRLGTGI